jgi:hypothetical protein
MYVLQAVCSRYGLSIGGHAAPVVRLLMWLTAPVSWPIGKALDWLLGKENFTFGKRQIRALVDLHRCGRGAGSSGVQSRRCSAFAVCIVFTSETPMEGQGRCGCSSSACQGTGGVV